MAKMRTTIHNGRSMNGKTFGAKHNDRNFDTTKADNIDDERSKLNLYTNCYHDNSMTFEEVELRFYEETFGEQLRMTNEAYRRNGHPERCKTMEEWKAARRNAPEETVMQIGKMEEHADRKELFRCYQQYNRKLQEWNEAHGRPFTTMTTALHADEAVPHIQTRRVWHYNDEKGMVRIGQEKALAAAGVELPDPKAKEGQFNNRKMTFDAMCRSMWLEILHERGHEIETIPVPDGKHNRDKETVIREKYEAMQAETGFLEERSEELNKNCAEVEARISEVAEELEAKEEEFAALTSEIDPLREVKADLDVSSVPVLPVAFKQDEVRMKRSDYEKMKKNSDAYIVNRPRLDSVDEREKAVAEREIRGDQRDKELTQREQKVRELENYPQRYQALSDSWVKLRDENEFLRRLLGRVVLAVQTLIKKFGLNTEQERYANAILEEIGTNGKTEGSDAMASPIDRIYRERTEQIKEQERQAQLRREAELQRQRQIQKQQQEQMQGNEHGTAPKR